MQGVWNRMFSMVGDQPPPPIKVIPIKATLINIDPLVKPLNITLNNNTVTDILDSVTARLDAKECLARAPDDSKYTIWYDILKQTNKLDKDYNEYASKIMEQPLYGNVVLTGKRILNYRYESCTPLPTYNVEKDAPRSEKEENKDLFIQRRRRNERKKRKKRKKKKY